MRQMNDRMTPTGTKTRPRKGECKSSAIATVVIAVCRTLTFCRARLRRPVKEKDGAVLDDRRKAWGRSQSADRGAGLRPETGKDLTSPQTPVAAAVRHPHCLTEVECANRAGVRHP